MFPVVGEPHTHSVLQVLGYVQRLHEVDGLIDRLAISIAVCISSLEYVTYLCVTNRQAADQMDQSTNTARCTVPVANSPASHC